MWVCPKLKPLPQLNKLIKHFNKINKNVGVNRAPVRIRHSGQAGDLGRDTFEKENLKKCKIKELNGRPRVFGSDSPTGSGRARGSSQGGGGGRACVGGDIIGWWLGGKHVWHGKFSARL